MGKIKAHYHDEIEAQCRTQKIIAISSITYDEKHILIWDFDDIKENDMLKSLSRIQKLHGLSYIYVFKSKHGYNAICLDKFHIKEAHNIKLYTRFSDYRHTMVGYQIGSWCMRIGQDKKFMKILHVTDTWKEREQSSAHKKYLEKTFDITDFAGKFDKENDVLFESYYQDLI